MTVWGTVWERLQTVVGMRVVRGKGEGHTGPQRRGVGEKRKGAGGILPTVCTASRIDSVGGEVERGNPERGGESPVAYMGRRYRLWVELGGGPRLTCCGAASAFVLVSRAHTYRVCPCRNTYVWGGSGSPCRPLSVSSLSETQGKNLPPPPGFSLPTGAFRLAFGCRFRSSSISLLARSHR